MNHCYTQIQTHAFGLTPPCQHFDPEYHQPLCFIGSHSWVELHSPAPHLSMNFRNWCCDKVTQNVPNLDIMLNNNFQEVSLCSNGHHQYPLNSNTGRGEPSFYPFITTPTVLGTSQKHTQSSGPISALQKLPEGQSNCHFYLLSTSCTTAGKATGNW